VKLGKRDAAGRESCPGSEGRREVVVEQSYLVKADIEKSGRRARPLRPAMLERIIRFAIAHIAG
jgi:hypothetical protein